MARGGGQVSVQQVLAGRRWAPDPAFTAPLETSERVPETGIFTTSPSVVGLPKPRSSRSLVGRRRRAGICSQKRQALLNSLAMFGLSLFCVEWE